MNLKKFISGVSALTIAASAFAGMAVTANAAVDLNVDSITSSTDTGHTRVNDTSGEYQLVYEADLLITDGAKLTIAYYGGNNSGGFPKALGPGYIFDATASDGYVTVKNQNGTVEINSNKPYAKYHTGYTAHIRIVTTQVTGKYDHLGNSTISFAFDDANAYKQDKTSRYPSQNRTVTCRNLNGDNENEHVRTIRQTIEGTGAVTLSNVHIYTEQAPANFSVNMGEGASVSSTGEHAGEVATWYVATVTNNGGTDTFDTMTLKHVVDAETNETESDEQPLSPSITLANNASVYIGVIIDGGNYTAETITATVQ